MLYFLHGNDTQKSRKKLHELLDLAQRKRPGAEIFKINTENWNEGQFEELLVSRGLFEQKYTVVLDNLFEKKEIKDFILERLEKVTESEQVFLELEDKMDASTLKEIEKLAKQVQHFQRPEKDIKHRVFNVFFIADGLVKKDKKDLWIQYIGLLSKGAGAEEIHGVLFWQVKNMILASKTKNLGESGLSPFVYNNAFLGAKKYSIEELTELSSKLVNMTHRVRTGDGKLEIMLEKWILTL